MIWLYILIFIGSCVLLFGSGGLLVGALMRMAKFLGLREFVVAFFIMAIAGSVPNFFIGISSALHRIPQLSFGDIVGGNLFDLTIVVALAVLVSKSISSESRLVQTSALFTVVIAVMPLLLIFDGRLGRGDGILLILAFFFYIFWLFSKKERFTKEYNGRKLQAVKAFRIFIKDFGKIILGLIFLLVAAEGLVKSAHFFSETLNLPIALIGILIIGAGNCLPEAYFAIASARKGKTWMILGNLMGSVIVGSTLVLGTVALICPIEIIDFSPFAIARFFLIISAIFFFFFVRSDRRLVKREAIILLGIYIVFVLCEIFFF